LAAIYSAATARARGFSITTVAAANGGARGARGAEKRPPEEAGVARGEIPDISGRP